MDSGCSSICRRYSLLLCTVSHSEDTSTQGNGCTPRDVTVQPGHQDWSQLPLREEKGNGKAVLRAYLGIGVELLEVGDVLVWVQLRLSHLHMHHQATPVSPLDLASPCGCAVLDTS